MKNRINGFGRSFVSVLVLLCLLLGIFAPTIMAAEAAAQNTENDNVADDGVINYVSIGDSMTNGYGLDGYDAEAGVYDYGYASYANQFAAMLAGYTPEEFAALMAEAKQGFGIKFEKNGVTVNHAQLGLSASRPEDVNFLLNLDYSSQEVINLLNKYPDHDLVCWSCGDHSGVAYEDIVYCAVCKWDPAVFPQFDLPGWGVQRGDGKSVDDYEAWWTLVQGGAWNDLIGYGDFWTWKELVEDYRFGTVATYIKSVFGTDDEKAAANALIGTEGNYAAEPRDPMSNGQETAYVAKHFQEQIANADVVSLGIGNGNFGVWLMGRITTALMDYDGVAANNVYQVDRVLGQLDENDPLRDLIEETLVEIDPYIDAYVTKMMGDGLDGDVKKSIQDVCTYAVVSFIINYKGMVESILKINPDVKIVHMGLMNTYAGDDKMATEGQVTIGNILDVMFPPLNAFIAAVPALIDADLTKDAYFYYAEEYEIECLIQNFGDEDFYNWVGVSRNRFVTGVVGECDCGGAHNTETAEACGDWDEGIFWELLHGFDMGGITIQYVNPVEIKNYEALDPVEKVKFAIDNKDLAGSISVYLAIEDAICKSGRLAPVTLSTLTGLELGNPAILNKALSNFSAEQEKVIDDYKADAKAGLIAYGIPEAAITETDINDMSMILSLPVALSNALWTDTELCSMLAVVARNKLGNGLGAHPSVAGHAALAEEMIAAYENDWTCQKQTIRNVYEYILEYYDEAFALAYAYAKEEGYIEIAADIVADAAKAVEAAKAEIANADISEELKAAIIAELDAVVSTLETFEVALRSDNIETVDELLAFIDSLSDDVKLHFENVTAIIEIVGGELAEKWNTEWKYDAEEILNALADKAAEFVCEALKEGLPVVGDMLLQFVLNTPENIRAFINFVEEYGEYIEAFFDEYGDEFVEIFGKIVAEHGIDALVALINLGDDALLAIRDLVAEYGDEIWDVISVIVEALGYTDEVKGAIEFVVETLQGQIDSLTELLDALEEELENLKKLVLDASADVQAEINAQIKALEEKIEEIEALIAELREKVAELVEELVEIANAVKIIAESVITFASAVADGASKLIMNAICGIRIAIENLIKVLDSADVIFGRIAKLADSIADIAYAAAEALNAAAAALKALAEKIEDIVNDIREFVAKLNYFAAYLANKAADGMVELGKLSDKLAALSYELHDKLVELTAAVEKRYNEALTAEYVFDRTSSFYVALGDVTAAAGSASYADAFAKLLGMNETHYADLTSNEFGFTTDEALDFLALNNNTISKADLITLGYSNNGIYDAIADLVTPETYVDVDWAGLFGDNVAETVDNVLAKIEVALTEYITEKFGEEIQNIDAGVIANTAIEMIEIFVYAYISRMVTIHEVVAEIHEIAPEALVVILGAFNDFDGLILDETLIPVEGFSLNLGEYVGFVVDALNANSLFCAFINDNTIFVSTEGVETELEATYGDNYVPESLMSIIFNLSLHVPSEEGHAQIADNILAALDLTVVDHTHEYSYECDDTCDTCGDKRDVTALHTYSNPCDDDCDICGFVRNDASEHKYSSACDVNCDICGEARTDVAAHSFSAWKVDREATHNVMGRKVRTCALCGYTEYEYTSVLVAEDAEDGGVSAGLIVGISIPSVLALAAGGFSAYWFGYKKKTAKELGKILKKMFSIFKK